MIDRQRALLEQDMQQVVDRLHREETNVAPYRSEYRQLLDNHGKMIRAAMVLMFGRALEQGKASPLGPDDPLVTGGAAIEMLHLATLVHDDVLDEADIRRGQPTVHTVRGNKAAIYLGDLILSRYMEIMAGIAPDTAFIQEQAGTVCEIVGGELLQESGRGNTAITRSYYEQAIQGKTAALFRLACVTGVKLSQSQPDPSLLTCAHDYGQHLGMAFQIIDDIGDFDIAHDTGKPKLEDIRDRIYTLPVILALEDDPSFAGILEKASGQEVLAYLQSHPQYLAASKEAARDEISKASKALGETQLTSGVSRLLSGIAKKLEAQL